MTFHQLTMLFVALIAITNPLGNLAIFTSLVSGQSNSEQRKIALQSALAIFIILAVTAWCGTWILQLFGITLPAFECAGGLIIVLLGLHMLNGQSFSSQHYTAAEHQTSVNKNSIAVIPMAIPLVAGPGAMTTLIVHAQKFHSTSALLEIIALCFCISLILAVTFFMAAAIKRVLGDSGIKIASRIMGLVLVAIAFQILGEGLRALLPGLAG